MVELVDSSESWPVVDTADLHRDGWVVALREDFLTMPGDEPGEPFRRLVLEHPGAVVVLAVDAEDQVVCLHQYRHPAGRRFVQLPAGLIDQVGEDPLEVGRRELGEEVGLAAREWTHLVSTYSSPGISSELVHLYLARGLSDVGRGDFEVAHEEADMHVFRVPFAELLGAVLAGEVQEAGLMIAVLTAHTRGLVAAAVGGTA